MIVSHDGKVFYESWLCENPKAILILVHGLGGYSQRFFEFAPFLVKEGFSAYAIELKGFGKTSSIKGHINNFKTYLEELKSLVEYVKRVNPDKKVFMFGESMGGLITLDFAIHYQNLLDGIILVSPALKDKLPISIFKRVCIFFSSIFNPLKYYDAEFKAKMFTRDEGMIKKIDNDPLEVRRLTAWFFLSILKTLIFVNMWPKKITLPVFMLLAGKDTMVSTEVAKAYFKRISSKDKELKLYPEMYHALYIDKDRELVFKDIVEWINRHIKQ